MSGYNVIANYVGKIWGLVSVYIFVPLYIKILGVGAYGLISIYTLILTIVFFSEAGLSAALSREAARENDREKLASLAFTIEWILYTGVGIVSILFYLMAPYIVRVWFTDMGSIGYDTAVECFKIMAISFPPQVVISVFIGGMMGMQKQVTSNIFLIAYSAVRFLVVLLPLNYLNDIRVFFIWQALICWVFAIFAHQIFSVCLGCNIKPSSRFSLKSLKPIKKYAIGVFGISVVSGLNGQLDRLIVSHLESINNFSYYSLSSTLSQLPTILTLPIAMAMAPRLVRKLSNNDISGMEEIYKSNSIVISLASSIVCFFLMLFPNDLLLTWIDNSALPDYMSVLIRVLSFGALFLAIQLAPFHLCLANGHTQTNFKIGVVMLFIGGLCEWFFVSQIGMIGAAISWALFNVISFVYLSTVANKKFSKISSAEWYVDCNFIPILFALAVVSFAKLIVTTFELKMLMACLIGVLVISVCVGLAALCKKSRVLIAHIIN